MTITILHLSDIHISNSSDVVLGRLNLIVAATLPKVRGSSALVILVSGDIAQSGLLSEYSLAEVFFTGLIAKIEAECAIPVHIVMAPGNHDCDFSDDQDVRLAIVEAIKKKGSPIPEGFISTCVGAQENFLSFRNKFDAKATAIWEDSLWTSYTIEVEGKRIVFDMLNASWMSSRHEQQGGLLFPFERYKDKKQTDADLRIVTLHHPLNWYNQSNYLKFRDFIHRVSDIVMTGHEHQSSGRTADDATQGECAYIEGAALQMREDNQHSGFNIVTLDLQARQFQYSPYGLTNGMYVPSGTDSAWTSYRDLPRRDLSDFAITDAFRRILLDPGATLKHPSGISLTLDDIYVFPDLDVRIDNRSEKTKVKTAGKFSSKSLVNLNAMKNDVLIGGTEAAGKTCLLYRLFDSFHGHGFYPLLLRGKDLRRASSADIEKYIRNAIDAQYGPAMREGFLQLSKAKKVLLIDDLELAQLNSAGQKSVLAGLRNGFHRIVVTVGDNFELAEIFSSEEGTGLAEFDQYQISPLGYERRGDLIRKWISIGEDEGRSTNDILKVFDEAENLIENSRLQHITSTVPIYVLSLLQASASGLSKELHNSSFAHYYYFLIVGALEKGGIRQDEMGPYIAACTHLSWFIKINGDEQRISELEFEKFVVGYSEEWTQTDAKQLLKVLISSRLIELDGGAISFTYPYSYYYFLGRYASISLDRPEVSDYLQYCVNNLYVRECANTLLFLAHHTGNSVVLELIVEALKEHFSDRSPMTLAKEDVKAVTKMMAVAPALSYKAQKPEAYRKSLAKKKDEDGKDDGLVDKPSAKRELFHNILSLTKSIEIAGALLTHQFSNYQKTKKVDAIRQIFDGALRAVREIYSYFEHDHEQLVEALSLRVRQGSNLTAEQAEAQTRLAIGMLLRAVAAGFVNKAGLHLTSKDLAGHVDDVMGSTPSQAYKLIKISQLLHHPGRLPRLEIDRIVRDESSNPCVMGPLQLLVLQRMYMYETDFDDKDWATSVFSLNGAAKALELKHRKGPHQLKWRE